MTKNTALRLILRNDINHTLWAAGRTLSWVDGQHTKELNDAADIENFLLEVNDVRRGRATFPSDSQRARTLLRSSC